MNLDLWMPSLFDSKGGIQVYSNYFFDALRRINSEGCHNVFLKNDYAVMLPSSTSKVRYRATGQIPKPHRTLAYSSQLISHNLLSPSDLIISTHLNFTLAGYILKQLKSIPYWTVAHGIEAWGIQNPLLKRALRNADRILAVSHYTRKRLVEEQNLDPDRVVVLPNTFDSKRFKPAPKPKYLLEKYQLSPEQPVLLTVARLAEQERYKGYDQVLRAIPEIRQVIPNIHYVIVGKGPDRSRVECLIEELKLQDCVTLTGFIPDEQLCDYYNLCDVFAMPSKREGFGIVYLEALACGKPVLGGNLDGAVDALCNGRLGALVNPDSVQSIAETIIQIINKLYPLPLIYEPKALREAAIQSYGFSKFQENLATLLLQSGF